MSFLWFGIIMGFHIGRNVTVRKVIEYSCEQIEDRKSFDMCALTTETNLKKRIK
jgi:hypothetical protein